MKQTGRVFPVFKAGLAVLSLAASLIMAAGAGLASDTQPEVKPGHKHMEMPMPTQVQPAMDDVGLDEHLGGIVPGDPVFMDESGQPVRLGDFLDRPVLLQLVFYHCPQSCSLMMAGLANILKDVTLSPGKDFRILSISFDNEDTPQVARDTKANYMALLKPGFPVGEWHFLTGDAGAIQGVTQAVGFRFKRVEEHNFIHPNVLIALGPGGKIIRYLYGVSYLPFDVSMALTEASRGMPSISIRKLLTYCFDYDPKGKKYVFRTFRIMGGAVLLALGAFLVFLLRKGGRDREKD
ncbi:MAG: SCO family protein [Pseudomonadota bacterium]